MRKQIVQIEISRTGWSSLRIPWITAMIAEACKENDVGRIEVKEVKKRK